MKQITSITHNIKVSVKTSFLPQNSSLRHQHFVFAYQIEIENLSAETIQVLKREWLIVNGFGQKQIVRGEGVVGEKPIIAPNKKYSYISGTHFPYTVGCMSGFYEIVRFETGDIVQVEIPQFVMEVPYIRN
ncbi:MAG: Co2+/Mg2+ efflux protein ApaG [Bacteroidia bacterium]